MDMKHSVIISRLEFLSDKRKEYMNQIKQIKLQIATRKFNNTYETTKMSLEEFEKKVSEIDEEWNNIIKLQKTVKSQKLKMSLSNIFCCCKYNCFQSLLY